VLIKFTRRLHAKYRKKVVSDKLASRLEVIGALRAFVQAHVRSHRILLKFFGKRRADYLERMLSMQDTFDRQISTSSFARQISLEGITSLLVEPEEARCVVESFTAIYNAIVLGSVMIERVDEEAAWMLESMVILRDSCILTEDMVNFVVSATDAGVLKEKDAEILIHPLHLHLNRASVLFSDAHAGIHRNRLKRYSTLSADNTMSLESNSSQPRTMHETAADEVSCEGHLALQVRSFRPCQHSGWHDTYSSSLDRARAGP